MEIGQFRESIQNWSDQRLSDAYLTYNRRIEEPKYAINKTILLSMIKTIRQEWEIRKGKEDAEYIKPLNGLLSAMGYKVGIEGLKSEVRIRILKDVISGPLPLVANPGYMEEWGEDGSLKRIKKLKNCLLSFSNGGQHASHHEAIKDWKEDLEWLSLNF